MFKIIQDMAYDLIDKNIFIEYNVKTNFII